MKKILIISTVARQFYLFEESNIEVLKKIGFEVHGAANFNDNNVRLDSLDFVKHHVQIHRSPFSIKNLIALKQIIDIMKSNDFNVIHCHSPMGGVLGRLAGKITGIKNVIYTAHGFHFYKGASLKNWILYYPVEKFLSRFTDILIAINKEDYKRAIKLHAKKVVYLPGIGIDTKKFINTVFEPAKFKNSLGINENTTVILSIGELIRRKNYMTVLKSLALLKEQSFIFLICGIGELEKELRHLTKVLGLNYKVKFLGFRNDIPELCHISDVFIFPSFQEGLPVSLMEAMATGLPVICSNIRGNVDLIEEGKGGFLHSPTDVVGFSESIKRMILDTSLRKSFGQNNLNRIQRFDKKLIKKEMSSIYKSVE